MLNFTHHNPTCIVFGRGQIASLPELLPAKARLLLLWGGGSIKRNGVYEQVCTALQGKACLEFSGIEPNPLYETLLPAVELVKRERIDFLLAIGGGSVLDAAKFVAAAALWDGPDPWEILARRVAVPKALPLGCVLTLPATGSEVNGNAVISRQGTREKLAFISPAVYPTFSILDPATLRTLPSRQVANGLVDAFCHVLEQYMTCATEAPLQARQAEAILSTIIEIAPAVMADISDYDIAATFMWCATQAFTGTLSCGVPGDWSAHMIGHELTAFYGLDHARTLSIVVPQVLLHRKDSKHARLLQYARRVWGIVAGDPDVAVQLGIEKTRAFFRSLGMPTRLVDCGIEAEEAACLIGDRLLARKTLRGEYQDFGGADAAQVLRQC